LHTKLGGGGVTIFTATTVALHSVQKEERLNLGEDLHLNNLKIAQKEKK